MTRVLALLLAGVSILAACTTAADRTARSEAGPTTSGAPSVVAGLPLGTPPQIPYVQEGRYLAPTGASVVLPRGRQGVSGVVRYADGLLVSDAAWFEGTNGIALVRDGARVASWPSSRHCSSGTPVASADGGRVAWVTVRCPESDDRSVGAVHVARLDGSGELTVSFGDGLASVVGFLEGQVVYNLGHRGGAWVADGRAEPRRIAGVDHVHAVSPLGALIARVGDPARLVIDASGTIVWRAEAGDLVSFSPDGTKVLALREESRISVLDARDGEAVTALEVPAGTEVGSAVWETDQSLLMLVRRDGTVGVLRVGLDGHLERATTPVPAGAGDSPVTLLAQPR